MPTVQIDRAKALTLLEEVVNEAGADYSPDETCQYFNLSTGEPLCIIGRVLSKLGVDWKNFADPLRGTNTRRFMQLLQGHEMDDERWLFGTNLSFTREATAVLDWAQMVQDGEKGGEDHTWGNALAEAKEQKVMPKVL